MNEYRFYLLNDERHIQRVEIVALPDGTAALREAFKRARGGPVEVWQNARLIAHINTGGEVVR